MLTQKTIRLLIILAGAYALVGVIFWFRYSLAAYDVGCAVLGLAMIFVVLSVGYFVCSMCYTLGRKIYFWQQCEQDNF